MVWTNPTTRATNDVITASIWNTDVVNNLKAIGDAWTTYSSSWTGAGSNPAIGNGTGTAKYLQAGKLVVFYINLTMGSTTTYGSGQWKLTLPVAPVSIFWPFQCELRDSGVGAYSGRALPTTLGSSTIDLVTPNTTAGTADRVVTGTVPFTWGTGDSVTVVGVYEAA